MKEYVDVVYAIKGTCDLWGNGPETVYYGGFNQWHKEIKLAKWFKRGYVMRLINNPNFVRWPDGTEIIKNIEFIIKAKNEEAAEKE